HIEEEKKRRGRETKQAEERAKTAAQALQRATSSEAELKAKFTEADRLYQEARDEWKTANAALTTARAASERSQRDCAAIHGELPPEVAAKIAKGAVKDWAATRWPEAADMDALKAEARGGETARKALREAESALQRHGVLTDREASLGQ